MTYPDPKADPEVTLYPHAGGREWSTVMYDEWKIPMAVVAVPRTDAGVAAACARIDEATGPGALTQDEREFYARAALGVPDA